MRSTGRKPINTTKSFIFAYFNNFHSILKFSSPVRLFLFFPLSCLFVLRVSTVLFVSSVAIFENWQTFFLSRGKKNNVCTENNTSYFAVISPYKYTYTREFRRILSPTNFPTMNEHLNSLMLS